MAAAKAGSRAKSASSAHSQRRTPATWASLGWDDVAVIKLDRDDQLNMAQAYRGAVEPTETYSHRGWTYLRLPDLEEDALAILLRLAFIHVAPKRLSRTLSPP